MRELGIDCDFERTGELRSRPSRTRSTGCASADAGAGRSSTRTRSAPRSTRRRTSPGSGTATAPRWSTRPGWPGASPTRPRRSACGSTSAPTSPASTRDGAAVAAAHRARARSCAPTRVALGTNVFPLAAAAAAAAHRAGLRLRAHDRAALRRASSPSIGWRNRQGIGDSANQFHYYRLTADNRILWGGYDAIYHFGRRSRRATTTGRRRSSCWPRTSSRRSRSSRALRFTHRWGGAIDTCTRFCAFFGTAHARPGRPTPPATPGSASAPPGSPPTSCSTCSTAQATERTALEMVRDEAAAVPARAVRVGRHPAHPLVAGPRRPHGRAAATCWLRTLDRLGPGLRLASPLRPARARARSTRSGTGRPRPGRTPRRATSRRGSARGPPRG